jgi:uncharacterized protein (DUF1800 family)
MRLIRARKWRGTLACLALAWPAIVMGQTMSPHDRAIVNRLTWGENSTTLLQVEREGLTRWLDQQLHWQGPAPLPPAVQAQIAAMRISQQPLGDLVSEMEDQRRAAAEIVDPDQKQAALKTWQQAMTGLGREAQARSLLRDIYAPDQLREQMIWFWFNQFNVHAQKRDVRAMVGDYEDMAIRPHALGRYRDLLEATLRHPAMQRYLDNDQNAVGHINENYAREIMELHSMGVGSGYTQKDVQELARILTGVGVRVRENDPRLRPDLQPLYIHDGLFVFNPARHDFGTKQFLGHTIGGSGPGSGFGEVEQALDLIASSSATAHHISQRMASFFMGDTPPPALVDRMAVTFRSSDGDIAQLLRTMIAAPEFTASLGHGFKDPVHYVVSAIRLAYDGRVILNPDPALNWLKRLGEGLYAHETPDGYPLTPAAWTGPGQMDMRFEIARAIGSGSAGLFRAPMAGAQDMPAFPQLQNALYYQQIEPHLLPATKGALGQARSPQEWNTLFLSAPDFMQR